MWRHTLSADSAVSDGSFSRIDTLFPLQQLVLWLVYMREYKEGGCVRASDWLAAAKKPLPDYESYDFSRVLRFLNDQAARGCVGPGALLGVIYSEGLLGVKANKERGRDYFKVLLNSDEVLLQLNMGMMYEQGLGIGQL